MMRRSIAFYVAALGLALLALAKWIAGPGAGAGRRQAVPPRRLVELPKSEYRYHRPGPGRWEVIRTGLAILFNSVAFATMGA